MAGSGLLLPVLIGLEIVLSADNAIALAAIARKQPDPAAQQRALNLGWCLPCCSGWC